MRDQWNHSVSTAYTWHAYKIMQVYIVFSSYIYPIILLLLLFEVESTLLCTLSNGFRIK